MIRSLAPILAVLLCAVSLQAAPMVGAPVSGTYSTGGATVGGTTGPWTLTSTDSSFSTLRYTFDTPVRFSDLSDLGTAYNAVLGGIGGGAPRFQLRVDTDNNGLVDGAFLVHFGPPGTFVDPSLGPGNTGNLLALNDVGRFDLGGIGGSGYTNYAAALALAGNYQVHSVTLILDSFGGADKTFGIPVQGFEVLATPEPASLAVWSLMGVAGLAYRWRNKKRTSV